MWTNRHPKLILDVTGRKLCSKRALFSDSNTFDRDISSVTSRKLHSRLCSGRRPANTVKYIGRDTRRKRQVLKDHRYPATIWKSGVFYTFNTSGSPQMVAYYSRHSNLPIANSPNCNKSSDNILQKVFKMGVKVWSDATCIDFVEDKNAKDKVVVVKEEGCWSSIGRKGGDQLLSLGEECVTEGSAVHEIGHVLGFFHTMSRYDRDSYIRIARKNVDPIYKEEFIKMGRNYTEVYGLTYDYGSVMHYGELSWSINKHPTIIATNPFYQKTMGSGLISFSDIYTINEHYGCNAKCDNSTSAKCANEGFPHPRNCSVCICPSGYGGTLCDRRPSGCGEVLVATSEEQLLIGSVGHGAVLRDQFDFCNYMITAPEGKKIEVGVRSMSYGYYEMGCPRGGVEIKAQKDQKLTGYRFCSMDGSGIPIVSSSNRLPVILFNRLGTMEASLTYRFVD